MVAVPSTTNPSRATKTFMLLFTKTIAPNNARIINVTTVSTCANIHEDCPFISIIFTRKSSLISLSTTNIRLATNNNTRNGIKSMNSSFRCLPFRVTRLLFCSISCAVGCGKRVKLYPKRANKECKSTDKCRHPKFADVQCIHNEQSDGFCRSRTDNNTDS